MRSDLGRAPGFWSTVKLLLGAARKRSAGRQKRQQELLSNRAGKNATDWSAISFGFMVLFMILLNVFAAFAVKGVVESGQRIQAEQKGLIVVDQSFIDALNGETASSEDSYPSERTSLDSLYRSQAKDIVEKYGGSQAVIEQKLRLAMRDHGTRNFVTRNAASPGLGALMRTR